MSNIDTAVDTVDAVPGVPDDVSAADPAVPAGWDLTRIPHALSVDDIFFSFFYVADCSFVAGGRWSCSETLSCKPGTGGK